MRAREKRNIKIDLYVNGEYHLTLDKGEMTAKQGIAVAEKIARNYARGNFNHIMAFVHAGELAVSHMTAKTELDRRGIRHIELSKNIYNL
ncbi:MAG: hypothetical protein NC548_48570 [Lachnospiraceae bacterium]|nr:hypothetical protein [Bacteroides sp.]MCM1222350.1 hypothetical protein [Lachnospiraceae bacterium]